MFLISDLEEIIESLKYESKGTKEYLIRKNATNSLMQAKDIAQFASMLP